MNYIKNIFFRVLFIFLFIVNTPFNVNSEIFVGKIKGMTSILKPDYENLSPIWGAIFWETTYVENIYRFAPENAIKKLVKKLFFLQHDGITFAPTVYPFKIATHFTPNTIGKIVGLIESYNKKFINRENLEEQLIKTLESLIFNKSKINDNTIITIKKTVEKEIEKIKKGLTQEIDFLKIKQTSLEKLLKKIQFILGQKIRVDDKQLISFILGEDENITDVQLQTLDNFLSKNKNMISAQLAFLNFILNENKDITNEMLDEIFKKLKTRIQKLKPKFQVLSVKKIFENGKLISICKEWIKSQLNPELLKIDLSINTSLTKKQLNRCLMQTQAKIKIKLQAIRDKIRSKDNFYTNKKKHKLILSKNIQELVSIIISSSTKKSALYPINNTKWILLSFLWTKANNKQDFLNYFQAISNTLNNVSIFNNDDFLVNDKRKNNFLTSKYTAKNYKDISKKPIDSNQNELEQLTLLYLGFNVYENLLPPYIQMKANVEYKQNQYPDCGSTSLLNFFNIILYDPINKIFDLSILKNLKPLDKFTEFYTKHKNSQTMIDNFDLHNDWAEVVSGLNEDLLYPLYMANKCEIKGGINYEGMNKIGLIIRQLLPELSQYKKTNPFEQLSAALNEDIPLLFTMPFKNDNPQIINIEIEKKQLNSQLFKWFFYPNHFHFDFPEITKKLITNENSSFLLKKLNENTDPISYNFLKYFTMARCLNLNLNKITKKHKLTLWPYYLFLQKINNTFVPQIMKKITSTEAITDSLSQILVNLYRIIPNDYHDQRKGLKYLKKINFNKYQAILKSEGTFIKVNRVLDNPKTRLTLNIVTWLQKNLENISRQWEQDNLTDVMTTILRINHKTFGYDELLKTLYQWLQNNFENFSQKGQVRLIWRILSIKPQEFNNELLSILYQTIQKNLNYTNIFDPFEMEKLTKQILATNLQKFRDYDELLKTLYQWLLESKDSQHQDIKEKLQEITKLLEAK